MSIVRACIPSPDHFWVNRSYFAADEDGNIWFRKDAPRVPVETEHHNLEMTAHQGGYIATVLPNYEWAPKPLDDPSGWVPVFVEW